MYNTSMYGRGHYYIARVLYTLGTDSIFVEFEKSDIKGPFDKPFFIDQRNYKKLVKISRDFIKPNTLAYNDLDPAALYMPGDRVMIMEDWNPDHPSRVNDTPGGEMEIFFTCIGKWRGTRLNESGPSINI